jgi:hypothetical protein
MSPVHCSYTSCTRFAHCLLILTTMGEYLGASNARVPGSYWTSLGEYHTCEHTSETNRSNDSETTCMSAPDITPASFREAALDKSNTSFGLYIASRACGSLSGTEVFVMQETNTLIDASTRLHISTVLTRCQPTDCGKQISHSAHCILESICPSHNTWMDAGITDSCIATTNDNNDCPQVISMTAISFVAIPVWSNAIHFLVMMTQIMALPVVANIIPALAISTATARPMNTKNGHRIVPLPTRTLGS